MKVFASLFLVFSLFVFNLAIVNAAPPTSATDLVSCDGGPTDPCGWCSLIQLFDNVIDFLFVIFTLAGVAMVMYVGFKMVTSQGSSEAWEEGKKMFSSFVIGFVIFLSAWLIVDTILKGLIDTESGFGVWNELGDCD